MNKPLISVIIPAHNSASTIHTAITSIIRQTYKNLEIIIVDDNSTDDTKKIIEPIAQQDTRVKYYSLPENDVERFDPILHRNTNAGYAARNFGFTKATGALITFQDADDASLLNRIEVQYDLFVKYDAIHLCTTVAAYDKKHIGTTLNMKNYPSAEDNMIGPEELYALSQITKGLIAKISPTLNTHIPFHFKRLRVINKFFFGSLAPYPGAGNSPLFKREVIEKVKFRKLSDRIWPSFMGRGADRDFNFQVAETFKNSYVFPIPLYMWSRESVAK
ncbi:MAG: glycosyltransferase family 2 protein [Candidatus Yonathbacteria bacterium]|nr:glycosyltransferase family 2 protein [Candidatus Yonathbacteria bacterium]